jgi:hypothetical protein
MILPPAHAGENRSVAIELDGRNLHEPRPVYQRISQGSAAAEEFGRF